MLLEIVGVSDDWRCLKCGGHVFKAEGHYHCSQCRTIYLARILQSSSPRGCAPNTNSQRSERIVAEEGPQKGIRSAVWLPEAGAPPSWECIFCRQMNPKGADSCWCGRPRYEWPPHP